METPFPSRELLLAITDVAQDLNGAVTPDGTVVYVSAAISRIVGFDTGEAVGTSMFRFIAPDDHASVQSALTTVAAGSPVQFRCHLLDQRDQPRLVEVRARPAPIDGQQYLVFSAHDATDALHAEKARAESEVRFRRLMDAAPDAMVVIQDARVVFANKTAAQMFGPVPRERLLGRSMSELMHPDDLDETMERQRRIEAGESLEPLVRRLVQADGTVVWAEARGVSVSFKGRPAVLSIIRRVSGETPEASEFELAMSRLRAANTELTQFADTLTRDLHEPLRMIGGFLQLLRRRHQSDLDAESMDYIDTAVSGVRRIESLITDLKEFSRIHTHGRPLRPVSLETVVIAAQRRMAQDIEAAGFRCHHAVLPLVVGDESQLVKAFCHLFSNAIKYGPTDDAPMVEVRAERKDTMWEIEVRDNGIGIDPHHQDRVFEVFRRLQPQDKTEGTGIGLATVKRIIERHRGQVWLRSNPGVGTSFFLTLPVPPE